MLLDALDSDRWPTAQSLQNHLRTLEAAKQQEAIVNQDFAVPFTAVDDGLDLVNNNHLDSVEDSHSSNSEAEYDIGEPQEESEGESETFEVLEPELDVEDESGFLPLEFYDNTPFDNYKWQHHLVHLSPAESVALSNFEARIAAGGSENLLSQYTRNFNDVFHRVQEQLGADSIASIMSHHQLTEKLTKLTSLKHIRISCCVKSCCAFFGPYRDLTECPYCKEPKSQVRSEGQQDSPQCTWDIISLIKRLRIQYADPLRARTMQMLEVGQHGDSVQDIWDGNFIKQLKDEGFFSDKRDLALGVSMDGIQMFQIGDFEVTPVIITNFNLPPSERYNTTSQIVLGVIPGPSQPQDLNSFLWPIVDELKLLEDGVPAWDAYKQELFTLKAHLIMVQADSPAMAKAINFAGYHSYTFCWHCTQVGIHHAGAIRCPHVAPADPLPTCSVDRPPVRHQDVTRLPMRTHGKWISDAQYMELVNKDSEAERQREVRLCNGVKGFSPLLSLKTIRAPYSFVVDGMHVLLANVQPLLVDCWAGTELLGKTARSTSKKKSRKGKQRLDPSVEQEGEEGTTPNVSHQAFSDENDYHISTTCWKDIENDQLASQTTMPSAVGVSLRPITTHHKRWTAAMRLQWILQSPVLLMDRLPEPMYTSWCSFVRVFQAVLKTFKRSDAQQMRLSLCKFVLEFEQHYYKFETARLHVCRSQIHSLLHIMDSCDMFGPLSGFWQFPMERIAGRLKNKAHNRSLANRNISLLCLYVEQLNHINFICKRFSATVSNVDRATVSSQIISDPVIHTKRLCLSGPSPDYNLTSIEIDDLATYLSNVVHGASLADIKDNLQAQETITRYKRAMCYSDLNYIGQFQAGSELGLSRRRQTNSKNDTWVLCSYNNGAGIIRDTVARNLFFACIQFQGKEFLLARIAIHLTTTCAGLREISSTSSSVAWTSIQCLQEPVGRVFHGCQQFLVGKRTGLW